MESKTILDTYKRYLRTLNCSNAELFTNYKTITDFISENSEGDELWLLLQLHCIGKNLKEIRRRGIMVKDYCKGDWDALAIRKGCKFIENIKMFEMLGDSESYKANSYNFWELILKRTQSPYVQLFLLLCFADRLEYHKLFAVSMKEIEEAAQKASEEEEMKQAIMSPTEEMDYQDFGNGDD